MKIALFCTNEFSIPLHEGKIFAPLPLFEKLVLGLAEAGHEIHLYASSNSKLLHKNIHHESESLVSFDRAGYKNMWGTFHDQEVLTIYEQFLLSKLIEDDSEKQFDVIHIFHQITRFLPFLRFVKTPIVVTLHDPINDKRHFLLSQCNLRNKVHYVSISNNQRKDFPDLNYVSTIYNGIQIENIPFTKKPQNYLVFFGRICFEKGAHIAVEAAKLSRMPLKMLGPLWGGEKYWHEYIAPHWNPETMEHLGYLPQQKAWPIIAEAKASLLPILWEEPFGLTMIEAMACGTPVIAFNRGSVSEIVENGKNGFIVNSVEEMAEKIKELETLKREECRKRVTSSFSLGMMIQNYEAAYRKVIERT